MEEKKVEVSKGNEKLKERYELTEVVTQTSVAVKDNKSEKVLGQEELLVEILNKVDKIEKAVA